MRRATFLVALSFFSIGCLLRPDLASADALDDAKKLLFGTLKSLENGGSTAACDLVNTNTSRLTDQLAAQALKSPNPKTALNKLADRAEEKIARNNPDNPQETSDCVASAKNIARKKIDVALIRRAEQERKRKVALAAAEKQAKLAEQKRQEDARLRILAAEKRATETKRKKAKQKREQARLKAAALRQAEAEKKSADEQKRKAELQNKRRAAAVEKKKRAAAKANAEAKLKAQADAAKLAAKNASATEPAKTITTRAVKAGGTGMSKQQSDAEFASKMAQLRAAYEKLKLENLKLAATLSNLQQDRGKASEKLEMARSAAAEGFKKNAALEAGNKKLQANIRAQQESNLRQHEENKRLNSEILILRQKTTARTTASAQAAKISADTAEKISTLQAENRALTKKLAAKNTGPSPFVKFQREIEAEKSLRKTSELKVAELETRLKKISDEFAAVTKSATVKTVRRKTAPAKVTVKFPNTANVAGMPTRDDISLQKFCRLKNTDRGRLSQSMFRFCLTEESQGYAQMAALYNKNARQYPWLKKLLKYAMTKWENDGVTSYNMASFTVKEQFEAFIELERKKKKTGFDAARYARCIKKWVNDTRVEFLMAGYCYEQ